MATTVLGLPRLRRKLKELPSVARVEIQAAMEAAAEEIANLARNLVPVEHGTLKKSIGWTWGDPPKGSIILGRSKRGPATGNLRLTIFAGNDEAFYARWVEFGTASHSLAKGADSSSKRRRNRAGRQHPGSRAQPFFYPAYRANRKRAKSKVSRAITKAAKKVAGKA